MKYLSYKYVIQNKKKPILIVAGCVAQAEGDLILKKDRNTPENKRDFEGDGSDGIQAIANIISQSLAGTDANGVVDLSDKLDDELSIIRDDSQTYQGSLGRVSSIDPNYFDPPIPVTSNAPNIPRFYVGITKYILKYSGDQIIDIAVSYTHLTLPTSDLV